MPLLHAQQEQLADVKITLQLQHESLQAAFEKIESQCNYRFAFRKENIAPYNDMVLEKGTRTLLQTLTLLFANTSLQWQFSKNSIIVTEKGKPVSPGMQKSKILSGIVRDSRGKPVAFANIALPDLQTNTITKENGEFRIDINVPAETATVLLVASYVGKQDTKIQALLNREPLMVEIVMPDLSLSLKEVQVTGFRQASAASNSSIVFGKQAIEQTQPTSIADVLQYMPGQTITAPDLQNAKTINLRNNFSETRLTGNQAFINNAAFGTAIIVDGSPVSNNANMQSLNIGKLGSVKSISASVNTGSAGTGPSYTADYAGSGVDLRQIPANNIESIEVVSGVASARYGDMTDGAVIVNRQAGSTPYSLSARFREGTANFGIEKGYALGGRLGSVNLNFDYLYSTADPRDKTKYYNRINTGLMWTSFLDKAKTFKHTFSFEFSKSLDGTQSDPDDKTLRESKFNFSSFAVSERGEIRLNRKWSKSITYNFRFSQSTQDSYSQNFLNAATALFVTDSKTVGVHEGEVVPAYNYIYSQQIKGKPINFFGRIENNLQAVTGNFRHLISVGLNYSYDANKGDGWLYDYRKPPLSTAAGTSGFKSDRPYTFSETSPAASNFSIYAEDRINMLKAKRPLEFRAGIRYDNQNRYNTLSPRISTNWTVAPHLKLNASYGISTKSPALVYTNPGPVYFDYPLIRAFNGVNGSNSLYLTYTDVVYNKNLTLKPSIGTNYEIGATYNTPWLDISVSYFQKQLSDGFTTIQSPRPVSLKVYDTLKRNNPGDKWQYYNTGRDTTYQSFYSLPVNGLSSNTKGVEVVINTRKIKAIQTSFFFTTAWYKGKYHDASPDVNMPSSSNINKEALYGVYTKPDATTSNVKSTLVTTHHFPKLGFIVNFTGEFFWRNTSSIDQSSVTYPVGYYDKNLNYFPIDPKTVTDPKYAHLVQLTSESPVKTMPIVYTNFHMRLSKEIGNLRISFNAYNFFNIRPEYIDNSNPAKPVIILNQEPSYGAELVLKF